MQRSWRGRRARSTDASLRTIVEAWRPGMAAIAVTVVLLPLFAWLRVTAVDLNDLDLYRSFGDAILAGGFPYRDVPIEYPPAAVPMFVLPALVASSPLGYKIAFAGLVGVVGMGGLALAARLGAMVAPPSAWWLVRTLGAGVTIALLGSVALTRFDLVPAALTVAGLYALARDRFGWAAVLLGTAIAVKIYPVVILPLAAVYVLRRRGRRAMGAFLATATIVVALTYLPFLLLAPDGIYENLRVQVDRHLQVESSGTTLLWLATATGIAEVPPQDTYYDIHAPAGEGIRTATMIMTLAVLALVWWRYARGPADRGFLVRCALASIAAFVVFGKVLSPQYLLWLVLLVPTVRGARANAIAGLLASAALVTAVYFPRWFPEVVEGLAPHVLAAIALRNLLLMAMLVLLVWPTDARERAGADHPDHAAPPPAAGAPDHVGAA